MSEILDIISNFNVQQKFCKLEKKSLYYFIIYNVIQVVLFRFENELLRTTFNFSTNCDVIETKMLRRFGLERIKRETAISGL